MAVGIRRCAMINFAKLQNLQPGAAVRQRCCGLAFGAKRERLPCARTPLVSGPGARLPVHARVESRSERFTPLFTAFSGRGSLLMYNLVRGALLCARLTMQPGVWSRSVSVMPRRRMSSMPVPMLQAGARQLSPPGTRCGLQVSVRNDSDKSKGVAQQSTEYWRRAIPVFDARAPWTATGPGC